jgi:hypothetical protein
MTPNTQTEEWISPDLVAKGEQCGVCGLKQTQLPPMWRFLVTETGLMACRHPFDEDKVRSLPVWTPPHKDSE